MLLSILDIPNFIVPAKMWTERHRPLPAVRCCTQRGGCMSEVRVPQEEVVVTLCVLGRGVRFWGTRLFYSVGNI